MSQLMQACSPATTDELVDIREVAVDKALPKEERIAAFLHQIKIHIASAVAILW